MKNYQIKKIFLLSIRIMSLLMFILGLYIFAGIYCSRNLEITTYNVPAKLKTPLRLIQLTDLHNSEHGEKNSDLIEAVSEQNPDLILLTGDMINSDDPDLSVIISLIHELIEIAPVYYGYGNHEVSWEKNFSENLKSQLTDAGAVVVQDDFVDVDIKGASLRIGGCMNYYRKWGMLDHTREEWDKEETFANSFENTDRYKILLNHIPTSFADWGGMNTYDVDLVLSGHYHGGIIRIPWLNRGLYAPYIGFFPPFTKGIEYGEISTCVISAGLGNEHFIPRVFNCPEIVVLTLQ